MSNPTGYDEDDYPARNAAEQPPEVPARKRPPMVKCGECGTFNEATPEVFNGICWKCQGRLTQTIAPGRAPSCEAPEVPAPEEVWVTVDKDGVVTGFYHKGYGFAPFEREAGYTAVRYVRADRTGGSDDRARDHRP